MSPTPSALAATMSAIANATPSAEPSPEMIVSDSNMLLYLSVGLAALIVIVPSLIAIYQTRYQWLAHFRNTKR